jgi:mRNA interferase HigB
MANALKFSRISDCGDECTGRLLLMRLPWSYVEIWSSNGSVLESYHSIFSLLFCCFARLFVILQYLYGLKMRVITEEPLKRYIMIHPDAKTALQEWLKIVKAAQWEDFADIKRSFNSVDNVGNQHYVFNIKGNHHRLVVVIKFTIKWVYIRFIGTHAEYDRIDCSTI